MQKRGDAHHGGRAGAVRKRRSVGLLPVQQGGERKHIDNYIAQDGLALGSDGQSYPGH